MLEREEFAHLLLPFYCRLRGVLMVVIERIQGQFFWAAGGRVLREEGVVEAGGGTYTLVEVIHEHLGEEVEPGFGHVSASYVRFVTFLLLVTFVDLPLYMLSKLIRLVPLVRMQPAVVVVRDLLLDTRHCLLIGRATYREDQF